ncbi:hypothetical protein EUTSA_v10015186mg [Eutrema salsugineum]|uniref:Uncharacterized protein n=1 Tax=Eutrema salsugineum TaxID=72664 RepID=V4LMQ3_EUTSA|nr:hypothetical protein EUTSA_v10015186mg [Eutrema salsugineum]
MIENLRGICADTGRLTEEAKRDTKETSFLLKSRITQTGNNKVNPPPVLGFFYFIDISLLHYYPLNNKNYINCPC